VPGFGDRPGVRCRRFHDEVPGALRFAPPPGLVGYGEEISGRRRGHGRLEEGFRCCQERRREELFRRVEPGSDESELFVSAFTVLNRERLLRGCIEEKRRLIAKAIAPI